LELPDGQGEILSVWASWETQVRALITANNWEQSGLPRLFAAINSSLGTKAQVLAAGFDSAACTSLNAYFEGLQLRTCGAALDASARRLFFSRVQQPKELINSYAAELERLFKAGFAEDQRSIMVLKNVFLQGIRDKALVRRHIMNEETPAVFADLVQMMINLQGKSDLCNQILDRKPGSERAVPARTSNNAAPEPMDTSAVQGRSGYHPDSADLSHITCFNCSGKGHYSNRCPRARRSNPAGAPATTTRADGPSSGSRPRGRGGNRMGRGRSRSQPSRPSPTLIAAAHEEEEGTIGAVEAAIHSDSARAVSFYPPGNGQASVM